MSVPAVNMRRVDEQSHKDEMRAALRGDFERLRARRDAPGPKQDPGAAAVPRPARASPIPAPERAQPDESWLGRLLGR